MVYGVYFNRRGKWDSSQEFRVAARTENFISLVATDKAVDHIENIYLQDWWEIGERIIIPLSDVYECTSGEWIFEVN